MTYRILYIIREIMHYTSILTAKILSKIDIKNKRLNPLIKIYTLTYDNSNEAVHNKVLYFPEGLNGWKYWRCYTPFTKTNCKVENPSIAVSQNGYDWITPQGLVNPIENLTTPEDGFYSDPHLLYNTINQEFECWFRYSKHKGGEFIFRKKSKNGIEWSDKELLRTSEDTFQSLVCPVIIFEKDKYCIWIITNDNDSFSKGSYIKYYESINGNNWTYIRDIKVKIKPDHMPWHFDIIKDNNRYIMAYSTRAISDYNNLRYIAIAESNDNTNYESKVLLHKSNTWYRWDNYKIHRPSLTRIENGYLLYYSAQSKYLHWGTGCINFNKV